MNIIYPVVYGEDERPRADNIGGEVVRHKSKKLSVQNMYKRNEDHPFMTLIEQYHNFGCLVKNMVIKEELSKELEYMERELKGFYGAGDFKKKFAGELEDVRTRFKKGSSEEIGRTRFSMDSKTETELFDLFYMLKMLKGEKEEGKSQELLNKIKGKNVLYDIIKTNGDKFHDFFRLERNGRSEECNELILVYWSKRIKNIR